MPEKFCRTRQRAILSAARDVFPDAYDTHYGVDGLDASELFADIFYLAGHGLLIVDKSRYLEYDETEVLITITSDGIDFLEDDGGLSAILGVVTVRLHDDTIKNLIEAKILDADLPEPDKRKYVDALRELPAESTKHLAMKLIDAGLENAPAVWTAIKSVLPGIL